MARRQRKFADEVVLPGDRVLAYTEYGDPDGVPVVYCHGTPGARVSGSILRSEAAELGVRVVAPDRPGIGRSEYQANRSFADWANDVAALMDALDVQEYGVVGVSGGGPYALACAAHTPERVTRCGVVSTVAPPGVATDEMGRFDRALFALAKWSPHLGRPLVWLLRRNVANATRFTDVVGEPKDGDLADPRVGETGRILLSDMREAVRQGSLEVAADYGVLASDWDFDLADVTVPTRAFHGGSDESVPLAAGEHVVDRVPDAELIVYENEGHIRPAVEHGDAVLAWTAGVNA